MARTAQIHHVVAPLRRGSNPRETQPLLPGVILAWERAISSVDCGVGATWIDLEPGQPLAAALAAPVGVAPLNCESGILRGRRIIWGGRARVRAASWMGTLVAVRHNPAIRTF